MDVYRITRSGSTPQSVWKKCHRKLTPACLKLSLVRTVEMMSKDSSYFLAPGVFFSANFSDSNPMPADLARSLSQESAPLDDLVSFAISRYMRSLTLNVNLVDFFSGGNETLQNSMVDAFSGRGKGHGLGGYGGLALVMGGSLASMMLAALAALAGKAMMTSMLALMMSALAAMKGSGGGGGGEHKTYEVITKPIVSHVNTHSSEVQHEHGGHHHYRKRSLDQVEDAEPYRAYEEEGKIKEKSYLEKKKAQAKREVSNIHRTLQKEPRSERSVIENDNRYAKDSSETFDRFPIPNINDKGTASKNSDKKNTKENIEEFQKKKRNLEETYTNKKEEIYNFHNKEKQIHERNRRNSVKPTENKNSPQVKSDNGHSFIQKKALEVKRDKRHINHFLETHEVGISEKGIVYNQLPPFKYIPNYQNLRLKRSIDSFDPQDSRIFHIRMNPFDYTTNSIPVSDQFTMGNKRYKRHQEENLIMPLALVR